MEDDVDRGGCRVETGLEWSGKGQWVIDRKRGD